MHVPSAEPRQNKVGVQHVSITALASVRSVISYGQRTRGAEPGLGQVQIPLKTPTSLNKEVRPLFLSDNSIWSCPSVFPQRLQHLEVLKAILALQS